MWKPISEDQPFELIPAVHNYNDFGRNYCITQRHHPKDMELLGMENCEEARKFNTSLYGVFEEFAVNNAAVNNPNNRNLRG